MGLKKYLLLALWPFCFLTTSAQTITSIAGNGTYGYSGDGGPGTSAQLAWPTGIAADNMGNIYICDHDNNAVRKVNSAGIITAFAGTGVLGYSGDGGPATAAKLYHPAWVTTDNAGNVYFMDQNSEAIRKVDLAGIITTVVDLLPDGYSGDGGPLVAARFMNLAGITFDNAGNMYLADFGNGTIRKVNTAGIVSTIAGTGIPGYSGDGGPATSAQLGQLHAVDIDNLGNIYIPDNNMIRKIDPAGIITTIAGNATPGYSGDGGPASAASFLYPWLLAVDNSGNLYVADAGNNVVRKINTAGTITTFAGNGTPGYSGDGGLATDAEMNEVSGIAIDNAGNVYAACRNKDVVRKINNCLAATISQQASPVILCNSGNASFTVTATNLTGYQWQVNTGAGWADISDNALYATTATNSLHITGATVAMDQYQYRCVLKNNCADIYSAPVLLTVNTPATPSNTISATATTICAGESIKFLAVSAQGGTSPTYQWKKNGLNTGSGTDTYEDNALIDGDVIECILGSSAGCLTTNTATSNAIRVTVRPVLPPSVSMIASSTTICAGTSVTFRATPVNGGAVPAYTWVKNGVNLSLDAPTYTDGQLKDGDIILCTMRSAYGCIPDGEELVISQEVTMNVDPLIMPTVEIALPVAACSGKPVTFTATPFNGGTAPSYQWMKNDMALGTTGDTYTANDLSDGDVISCVMISNGTCLASPTATGKTVPLTVFPNPSVTLDPTSTLCMGTSRQLDAGSFSSYLWNNGSTNHTLMITGTGVYSVQVKDAHGCEGTGKAVVSTLLPLPSDFMPADTAICSYGDLSLAAAPGYMDYLWNTGGSGPRITVAQPGDYWLEVTDHNNCKAKETVKVAPKECLKGFFIPNAFTPDGDGRNDTFTPILLGNVKQYNFSVYNRWGQLVFYTKEPGKGWDGTFGSVKQDTNVYVWMCTYQLDDGPVKTEKGTVVIIR